MIHFGHFFFFLYKVWDLDQGLFIYLCLTGVSFLHCTAFATLSSIFWACSWAHFRVLYFVPHSLDRHRYKSWNQESGFLHFIFFKILLAVLVSSPSYTIFFSCWDFDRNYCKLAYQFTGIHICLYGVFQTMNSVCLSIYWDFLWFLSPDFYSFWLPISLDVPLFHFLLNDFKWYFKILVSIYLESCYLVEFT